MEEEEEEEEITEDKLRVKPRPLPVSAWSSWSYIPPRRTGPKENSYFYQEGKTGVVNVYDCIYQRPPDYNQHLHRDDREHAKSIGLKVNEEEWARPIGVLSSSIYGRHIYKPVEELNREHVRVNYVKGEFYRKNAITCMEAPGFGHIAPS
ncbi:cilia- and flagella-associated protein 90 [Monodelphis domestica]|uniref:Cilia and flagella associated protein 90 n=1 Tax=Monodelphis domestica TaxID=13616 RepID=A0A5F8GNW1_MONDO|nr:cilia- and flagella-associated protein 90 [Monodelphis domestica]